MEALFVRIAVGSAALIGLSAFLIYRLCRELGTLRRRLDALEHLNARKTSPHQQGQARSEPTSDAPVESSAPSLPLPPASPAPLETERPLASDGQDSPLRSAHKVSSPKKKATEWVEALQDEPVTTVDPLAEVSEQTAPRSRVSLEEVIGQRFFAWAGAAILLLGLGFFLKYAYDLGWIGPTGRLAMGVVFGALAIGSAFRSPLSHHREFGDLMIGIGFSVFYLCVYFAFGVYGLWGAGTSFVAASCVSVAALGMALFRNREFIALMALAGGFASPVLFTTDSANEWLFMGYLVLLNLLALFAAHRRQWRITEALTIVATYVLWGAWYFPSNGEGPSALEITSLLVFWGLYLGNAVVHGRDAQRRMRPEPVLLTMASSVFSAVAFASVFKDHDVTFALILVAFGIVTLVAQEFLRRQEGEKGTALKALSIQAAGLFLLAPMIVYEGQSLAVAYGAEALTFGLVAAKFRSFTWSQAGLLAQLAAVGALLSALPLHSGPFTPVFNQPFGIWFFVATQAFVVAYFLKKCHERRPWTVAEPAQFFLQFVGGGLFLALGHQEITALWTHSDLELVARTTRSLSSHVGFWSTATLFCALTWRRRPSLVVHVLFVLVALVFAIVVARFFVSFPVLETRPLLSLRFATGFGAAMTLGAAAWLLRTDPDETPLHARLVAILGGASLAVFVINGHLEVDHHVLARSHGPRVLTLARLVYWSLLPSILIIGTFSVAWRRHRVLAGAHALMRSAATALGLVVMFQFMRNDGTLVFHADALLVLASIALLWWDLFVMRHRQDPPFHHVRRFHELVSHGFVSLFVLLEILRWARAYSGDLPFLGEVTPRLGAGLVSACWAVQAFVLVVVGLKRQMGHRRWYGILLFGIVVVKVLALDTEGLNRGQRILSFMGTGLCLLAASFAYHRFRALWGQDATKDA